VHSEQLGRAVSVVTAAVVLVVVVVVASVD
jgi:hypothetical protein